MKCHSFIFPWMLLPLSFIHRMAVIFVLQAKYLEFCLKSWFLTRHSFLFAKPQASFHVTFTKKNIILSKACFTRLWDSWITCLTMGLITYTVWANDQISRVTVVLNTVHFTMKDHCSPRLFYRQFKVYKLMILTSNIITVLS